MKKKLLSILLVLALCLTLLTVTALAVESSVTPDLPSGESTVIEGITYTAGDPGARIVEGDEQNVTIDGGPYIVLTFGEASADLKAGEKICVAYEDETIGHCNAVLIEVPETEKDTVRVVLTDTEYPDNVLLKPGQTVVINKVAYTYEDAETAEDAFMLLSFDKKQAVTVDETLETGTLTVVADRFGYTEVLNGFDLAPNAKKAVFSFGTGKISLTEGAVCADHDGPLDVYGVSVQADSAEITVEDSGIACVEGSAELSDNAGTKLVTTGNSGTPKENTHAHINTATGKIASVAVNGITLTPEEGSVCDFSFTEDGARISEMEGEKEIAAIINTGKVLTVELDSFDEIKIKALGQSQVTVKPDGTIAEMDALTETSEGLYTVGTACTGDESCLVSQMDDYEQMQLAKAWYHDGVHFCLESGIMNGVENTTDGTTKFLPQSKTTRAQFAMMLWRYAGEPMPEKTDVTFNDVPENAWYAAAVNWAANKVIGYTDDGEPLMLINGYGDETFRPNGEITREELVTLMWRFARMPEQVGEAVVEETNILSYTDAANIQEYAVAAFQWAVTAKVIDGLPNAGTDTYRLAPNADTTRAQIATIFMRYDLNTIK